MSDYPTVEFIAVCGGCGGDAQWLGVQTAGQGTTYRIECPDTACVVVEEPTRGSAA